MVEPLSAYVARMAVYHLYGIKLLQTRDARFFLVHDTKTGNIAPNEHKMYQMVIKITNVCKIFQMAIKYSNIFQSKALQNLPKLIFLV
jgi:hypothetical protein